MIKDGRLCMVLENNVLTASTGKVLVNADNTVVSSVILGEGDSADNYVEVTESEAADIISERDLETKISELSNSDEINEVLSGLLDMEE